MNSFYVLILSKSKKSILQIYLVDLFLGLFLLRNRLYSFSLLKKMMKEVTFKHKIIVIKFSQLLKQITLLHNEQNHLFGDLLPYQLNPCLVLNLAKLRIHSNINSNHPSGKFQYPNTFTNKQYLSSCLNLY